MKDREAVFRRVFDDNYTVLMRVAYRVTGREDLSEEIVQEAFIKFYERLEQLPHDETIRYWLLRVVKNLSLNFEKRRGREGKAVARFGRQEEIVTQATGEDALVRDQVRSEVQEALMKVPYNHRIVLILKEYLGFSYAEIAESLGISEGNVKVRVHRGRLQLAEYLKQEGQA